MGFARLQRVGVILFFLFLFLFPKGGIKANSIPITWGYSIFGLLILYSLIRERAKMSKARLFSLIALLPLQIVITYSLLVNGNTHIGYTISLITSLFILPIGFYLTFSNDIESLPPDYFSNLIRHGTLLLACYGIFLFVYKFLVGTFIEIPFLTVNYHDVGTLETTKCIDRGGIFKLISTYNNGNVYGICILMLLPFYNCNEKSKVKRLLVKLSLLLTLSRTVWYGLVFAEIVTYLFVYRFTLKTWIKLPLVLFTYSTLITMINKILEYGNEFLFDTSLGGRQNQFATLQNFTIFPTKPFSQIEEIVPLSMLKEFGLIGMLGYYIAFCTPIIIALNQQNKSMSQKGLLMGMITYMFVSFSDGAFLLIPTLALFFFISSFSHRHVKRLYIQNSINSSL